MDDLATDQGLEICWIRSVALVVYVGLHQGDAVQAIDSLGELCGSFEEGALTKKLQWCLRAQGRRSASATAG